MGNTERALERRFASAVLANEFTAAILRRMAESTLPNWYLSGGCLFQTIWNGSHGFEPHHGIRDYDLFYFDGADLSSAAERAVAEDLARTFVDMPVEIEVRNQARVHLWYEQEFGATCRAFRRCEDGIDAFLATCCCFGVRQEAHDLIVYAPHGFEDVFEMVVRPNAVRAADSEALRDIYEAKIKRWSSLWPRLQVEPWPAG